MPLQTQLLNTSFNISIYTMDRRHFIRNTGIFGLGFQHILSRQFTPEQFPQVRRITHGPDFHWFGYYDKQQIDPTGRYVLAMKVNFEGRTPTENDTIEIGMIDLKDGDRWMTLGESHAWCWQQGCMLQWLPGSTNEVIWNDRREGKFISVILDIKTGNERILPKPIFTISPDGLWALGVDFSRLQNMRPGYGYKGIPDRFVNVKAPDETGIYTIDIKTGESKLIIPYSQFAKLPHLGEDVSGYWHWYNQILVSPDSSRFVFLNRWRKEFGTPTSRRAFTTRLITANKDGSDPFVIDPSGNTSHFIWADNQHICAWTRPLGQPDGFYLLKDKSHEVHPVGQGLMINNGHNTYLAGHKNNIIINDTYPQGEERLQELYLFDVKKNKRLELGRFHSPKRYSGEWRCDLHPRQSRDGKMLFFDSTHEGLGRQIYMIDISKIV
jgi:hypothetical protein